MAAAGAPSAAAKAPPRPSAARVRVPGLKRPCLESGRAWASATRKEEARAIIAMSRRGGRSKVYRELLRQCRDGMCVADMRAVSSVAARLGILERQVRKLLAPLDSENWVVRVHHAGLRFRGQRGWTTNVMIVPALLPAVPLMPPAAREKARKLLLSEPVRTALMQRGFTRQLRQAIGFIPAEPPSPPIPPSPPSPPPAPSSSSAVWTTPHNLSISTPMGFGSDFVSVGSSSSVSEILNVPPYPPPTPMPVDNLQPTGAVRADARTCSKPSSAPGFEGRDPAPPTSATVRPGIDGRSRGCLPEVRTVRLKRSEVVGLTPTQLTNLLEARGVPRSEAMQRAVGFSRVAAWRRWRRSCGGSIGRVPRHRGLEQRARQELERLWAEKAAAGEPPESPSATSPPFPFRQGAQ